MFRGFNLHREQADTGLETLSKGLWEKLARGIVQERQVVVRHEKKQSDQV